MTLNLIYFNAVLGSASLISVFVLHFFRKKYQSNGYTDFLLLLYICSVFLNLIFWISNPAAIYLNYPSLNGLPFGDVGKQLFFVIVSLFFRLFFVFLMYFGSRKSRRFILGFSGFVSFIAMSSFLSFTSESGIGGIVTDYLGFDGFLLGVIMSIILYQTKKVPYDDKDSK